MKEKKDLRKQLLKQRALLNSKDKERYDQKICLSLEQLIMAKKCATVHAYLPMGEEVNIYPLLQRLLETKIRVYTPKTLKNRKLEHLELTNLDAIESGLWGTKHPIAAKTYEGKFDLIIVPGLAFDENKNRLGYGGGYYDNFLAQQITAYKAAVAYPFQLLKTIPVEPHDTPVDAVIYDTLVE
ncbi:5-formyltetrahydrofolate cyclo-ligase [Aureispira anguillae]|uniref:5-formyltetrahydrofolate cyclo-ligase n=1 Tax=Aureispira anguillae TaxID=2864201 RepID=A0A915YEX3_9BACT|nr:5-formyltetrahydrofolate cyclo-ligase [Aureispira anguillae]BDS11775.1 5-formyltetrahydrofolate cyclo-ligase [Aureispira anguillae]